MVEILTDSPDVYDGFGTRTVAIVGRSSRGVLRRVAIQPQHLDWQTSRYGSGSYMALTREELLLRVNIGDVTLLRQETPVAQADSKVE